MAEIIPVKLLQTGSSGAKVDIDIASSTFNMVKGLAQDGVNNAAQGMREHEALAKEVQNTRNVAGWAVMKGVSTDFTNAIRLERQKNLDDYESATQNLMKNHDEFDEAMAPELEKMSKGMRIKTQAEIADWKNKSIAESEAWRLQQDTNNSIVKLTSGITAAFVNKDPELANELKKALPVLPAQKESVYESAKKEVSNDNYSIAASQLAVAPTNDHVDDIYTGAISQTLTDRDRARLDKAKDLRLDAIKGYGDAKTRAEVFNISQSIKSDLLIAFRDSGSIEEVEAKRGAARDADSGLTPTHLNEVDNSAGSRIKELKNDASSSIKRVSERLLGGTPIDESMLSIKNADPVDIEVLKEFSRQNVEGRGPNSAEFIEKLARANTAFLALVMMQGPEAKGTGKKAVRDRKSRKKLIKDFSPFATSIDELKALTADPSYSQLARTKALDVYAAIRYLDSKDGNFANTADNENLTDIQKDSYSTLQSDIVLITRGADNEVDNFFDMAIDPDKAYFLFETWEAAIKEPKFLEYTREEARAKYKEFKQDVFDQQIEKSAIGKLKSYLLK